MKRNLLVALLLLTVAAPVFAQTQPPPAPSKAEGPKPAAQDEFVPVNAPISAQDTIPAPRLVAIAYGFIWVALLGYVWSVRSRLTRVEQEIEAVSRRLPERK
jgi:CcmD family protein